MNEVKQSDTYWQALSLPQKRFKDGFPLVKATVFEKQVATTKVKLAVVKQKYRKVSGPDGVGHEDQKTEQTTVLTKELN